MMGMLLGFNDGLQNYTFGKAGRTKEQIFFVEPRK